jgi:hypothetical protein
MKSFLLLVLSALTALVSGFTIVTPSFERAHTALEGSRNKQKIASRSKWAAARGAGAAVAEPEVTQIEAVVEEVAEEEAAEEEAAVEEAAEEVSEE